MLSLCYHCMPCSLYLSVSCIGKSLIEKCHFALEQVISKFPSDNSDSTYFSIILYPGIVMYRDTCLNNRILS